MGRERARSLAAARKQACTRPRTCGPSVGSAPGLQQARGAISSRQTSAPESFSGGENDEALAAKEACVCERASAKPDRGWKADALSRRRRDASCVCARAGAQAPCTHGGRSVSGGCQGSGVKERQRASSVVGQTKEQGGRCAGVRKLSQRGLGGWLGSDGAHVGEEPGKLALRARGSARAVGLRAANVGLRKRRRAACAVARSRRSGHGDGHGRQRALPRAHAPVVAGRLPLACDAHGAHGLS